MASSHPTRAGEQPARRWSDDPDQVVYLTNVTWADYERIAAIRGQSAIPRLTYLDGVLELTSLGQPHESDKKKLARLFEAYLDHLNIAAEGIGSWTVKRRRKKRGAEADACYVFSKIPVPRSVTRPELVIEVIYHSGGRRSRRPSMYPPGVELADKIAESFLAPVGSQLPADDLRVIERDGWYQTITPSTRSSQGNEVIYSRIAAADAERVARETIAGYAALGLPFKWCVGPLTEPPDFGALLERLGFTSWPVRGMAVEPQRWVAAAARPDVVIERVTPATFDDHFETVVRGWAMEVEASGWKASMARALAGGRQLMYTARVAGEPVGTAGMIIKARSVYLVGGNVVESHRGRGIYRALIDERLRDAAGLGMSLATTQAREATSAPILERLGFETLFRSRVYKWQP